MNIKSVISTGLAWLVLCLSSLTWADDLSGAYFGQRAGENFYMVLRSLTLSEGEGSYVVLFFAEGARTDRNGDEKIALYLMNPTGSATYALLPFDISESGYLGISDRTAQFTIEPIEGDQSFHLTARLDATRLGFTFPSRTTLTRDDDIEWRAWNELVENRHNETNLESIEGSYRGDRYRFSVSLTDIRLITLTSGGRGQFRVELQRPYMYFFSLIEEATGDTTAFCRDRTAIFIQRNRFRVRGGTRTARQMNLYCTNPEDPQQTEFIGTREN